MRCQARPPNRLRYRRQRMRKVHQLPQVIHRLRKGGRPYRSHRAAQQRAVLQAVQVVKPLQAVVYVRHLEEPDSIALETFKCRVLWRVSKCLRGSETR